MFHSRYFLLVYFSVVTSFAIPANADLNLGFSQIEDGTLWQKQIYDYGRGSKHNKPPIRSLATNRLNKQVEAFQKKCANENGVLTYDENYISWGCCNLNSSRPCLYPGYPYPQDPGGCVAKVGASVSCSMP